MQRKYMKRIGGFFLAALMLSGVAFASANSVEAQSRRRRVIIVRPIHRPFGWGFGSRWGYPYHRWGYDPWSPYGTYYRQYVFDNGNEAMAAGHKQGFKTGKDDGKKAKSYSPERSHYFKEAGFGNFAEVYRSGFAQGYREGYRVGTNERAG
jgi:hypothetical protein